MIPRATSASLLSSAAAAATGAKDRLRAGYSPLFPLAVERENEIVIVPVPDPRAGMCPLLRCPEKIDRRFYRAVRRAGEYLLRDEDSRKYLLELSSEITDIAELAERL